MSARKAYEDLGRHLNHKLEDLINDTIDVCRIASLDHGDINCMLFGSLVGAAAQLVLHAKGNKLEFLNACSLVFDRAIKEV